MCSERSFSPSMPYMIWTSPPATVSARNEKYSNASHSKPSVNRPQSRNEESLIQVKR